METIKNEEFVAPKVNYLQKVIVRDVILEADYKNEKDIKKIRLVTDDKEITCKVGKTKEEIKKQGGFKVKSRKTDVYTVEDLQNDYPFLVPLYNECEQKKPQEITICYFEKEFDQESDGKTVTYYWMKDYQLKYAYYEVFHPDQANLKKQKEWQTKVQEIKIN